MNKRIFKIEQEITDIVKKDNNRSVHFEYTKEVSTPMGQLITPCKISAWTYNDSDDESFLLKSSEGNDYEECLTNILTWLQTSLKDKDPYTVTWKKIGVDGINKSYFYCNDVVEVVEKFFKGKEISEYQIFKIELMPIS
jgi:hypothetical protein